jgi:hypothetical protein
MMIRAASLSAEDIMVTVIFYIFQRRAIGQH